MKRRPPSDPALRRADRAVEAAEKAVFRAKAARDRLRRRRPAEEVPDYVLTGADGKPLPLSAAFGRRTDLLVVHNMGAHCTMCTMWADGFAGLWPHLADRAAFLLTTPDTPKAAAAFARRRGWPFPVASTRGTVFARDLGYADDDGTPWPGVSAFQRTPDGRILRTGHAAFGPGDDFNGMFPLMALLADGQGGWWPKLAYRRRR